jgi:hypothetical protein
MENPQFVFGLGPVLAHKCAAAWQTPKEIWRGSPEIIISISQCPLGLARHMEISFPGTLVPIDAREIRTC